MRFSATVLYAVNSDTQPCQRIRHSISRGRRRTRRRSSIRPSLLFWGTALFASLGSQSSLLLGGGLLVGAGSAPQSEEATTSNSESTSTKNQHGLDGEAQELLNTFLNQLHDLTFVDDLIQESNQNILPLQHQKNRAPPVMVGRRRSLLEHNVQRHYSIQYLKQLQEETIQRELLELLPVEQDKDDQEEQKSIKDNKEQLQEAIHAYLYQTPVDHHIKANLHRYKLNGATSNTVGLPPFPPSTRKQNAQLLRDMFYKSYNAYMEFSFPASELLPLTCQPGTFDLIRLPALTLIDALDTLLVLGDSLEFAKSVERLREFDFQHKDKDGTGGIFAANQNVSLFETTIRVLGGLLSAHQMAVAYLKNKDDGSSSSPASPLHAYNDGSSSIPSSKSSSKLPLVSLKEVYSDPHDEYLIPSEDVLQQLLQYDLKYPAGSQRPQTGSDGSCSVSGQASEDVSLGEIPPAPVDADGNIASGDSNYHDWREHCGAGLLSLEDCAASKAAPPKALNRTAAALLKKLRLEREPPWEYDGFLLELATDIGKRLLPAFETKTGIPFGTVNLLRGVPSGETTVASLAGGGTLSLEFELLSRLTGDLRFGQAAKLAIRALWLRRSPIQLFGKHIDIQRGVWTENLSGIGSNSDSFLEYLLKHYLLFPEEEDFWVMLQAAYSGIFKDARLGEWYADVDMKNGLQNWPKGMAKRVLESLMAFYPGLQTLMGEFVPAARSLNSFFMVREFLGFLPERFSYANWKVDGGVSSGAAKYPLRPELLESCYFMHRSTKKESDSAESSSSWQWAADFALHHLERLTRSKCGYASVRGLNPATGNLNNYQNPDQIKLDNDMPSFFLSETIKYLYLIFDDDNIIHNDKDRDWIFTTEAHPIHYVPTFQKQQEATSTTDQEDSAGLSSVKNHLRTKLKNLKLQREGHLTPPAQETPSASIAVSALYLMEEEWADSTQPREYRESIHETFTKINEREIRGGYDSNNPHPLKMFFGTQEALLDSMPQVGSENMYHEDNNLAYMTWNSLGLGSGYAMKKACANIYASEMTWVDTLNGGVLDYTDIYVTSFSESDSNYPPTSESTPFQLSSAEALSVHGSGIFLGNMFLALKKDEVCQLVRRKPKKTNDASSDAALNEPHQSESENAPKEETTAVQQVELDGIGSFDVSAFPDGAGFFMRLSESGESITTTFMIDSPDGVAADEMMFMVYASMPRAIEPLSEQESSVGEDLTEDNTEGELHKTNTTDTNEDRRRSPWKNLVGPRLASWWKNRRKGVIHDGADYTIERGEPERAVVIADLNQNAFHCEVNIIRRPFSIVEEASSEEEGEPTEYATNHEVLVATFPCAPALFGPTHISRLINSNGIFVEQTIFVPDTEDEFGCATEDEDVVPTAATVSDESDDVPVVRGESDAVESSDEEDEFTMTEEDKTSCENKTIQMVQRGHCSFFSKSYHQKQSANAEGVIVINTDDTELFIMSQGEDESDGVDENDIPVSVLVTGLDGEEMVNLIQSETVNVNSEHEDEVESYLLAQIHIFSQDVEFDEAGNVATDPEDIVWPVVRGSEQTLQVFAEGGWGIHATRKDGGSIKESASASDLQLFLLRHSKSDEN